VKGRVEGGGEKTKETTDPDSSARKKKNVTRARKIDREKDPPGGVKKERTPPRKNKKCSAASTKGRKGGALNDRYLPLKKGRKKATDWQGGSQAGHILQGENEKKKGKGFPFILVAASPKRSSLRVK